MNKKYSIISTLILFATFSVSFTNNCLFAQDLYDINTVQEIRIEFEQSNWDYLMDTAKAGNETYLMAKSVTINGVEYDSVGVKYKGNSTYRANQVKNPFHIELDTYKEQDYQGYKDIKLSNAYKDPSFIREVVSYRILRDYMIAPQSNFANVYVNNKLIGLYVSSESIGKTFVNKYFGSKNKSFFKCNPPDGAGPGTNSIPNLVYLGQDSVSYMNAYELKSDYGWKDLIELTNTLSNHTDDIESVLDVDRALWMLAFDNLLVNLDSYIGGFAQNYYLYKDASGRFNPIVWDLNESFGTFTNSGTVQLNNTQSKISLTPTLHINDAAWPLVQKILANPTYKKQYFAHMKTMIKSSISNNSYFEFAESLHPIIDEAVQNDPNKFFTYSDFKKNLTDDIISGGGPMATSAPGISNLMDNRAEYLLNLAEFQSTAPEINDISISDNSPSINTNINITANISNANYVYLAHRNADYIEFVKIQMYDDGNHNDLEAGDNIYGAELYIENKATEYYIYAENSDAGIFSPERAEFEFYTINAEVSNEEIPDIVINEFMADNDNIIADPQGEYEDWIELYNNSDKPISLKDWYLSDDPAEPDKWQFSDVSIDAGGYLLIWADDDIEDEGIHADLKLSKGGEYIGLYDANLNMIDSYTFGEQSTDISEGRYPNGTGDFTLMEVPTPGKENMISASEIPDIVINEFMADNDNVFADPQGEYEDWIELYNNSANAVSLNGWYLTDDEADKMKWQFPDVTLQPGEYLIIWADEDIEDEGIHADLKLSKGGEYIGLYDANLNMIDSYTFGEQSTDISEGRYPNATGDFTIMEVPTPGKENTISSFVELPNENSFVLYPNPASEYIEITFSNYVNKGLQPLVHGGEVEIYNMLGEVVVSLETHGSASLQRIDISHLPAGIYFVRIGDYIEKFVKK
jgi:hypothetical protein